MPVHHRATTAAHACVRRSLPRWSRRMATLVLDNLRPEILPAGQRPDLTPVFSFNDEGLWQGTGSTRAGNALARLSRWREVWGRTLDEGFR